MPNVNTQNSSLPFFITPDGERRFLAAFPTGKISCKTFRDAPNATVIPRSSWIAQKRPRTRIPILDQNGKGSCTGHGSTSAAMISRDAGGQNFQLLSPTFVYSQVNGGRDNGADPADCAKVIQETGICLMSEFNETQIFNPPANCFTTAKRFRASSIYQCTSYDEIVSAWLLGFSIFDTIHVGNNFNLNNDGVVTASSGYGNHCVCVGDELKKDSGGNWVIDHRNSWGAAWGNQGHFFMSEAHYENQPNWEAYCIASMIDDSGDATDDPPALIS